MADARVKHLRVNATRAETLLWHQLRRKRVEGLRFRRQFPLGQYVVDFVCLPARLIVEVDGPTHELTERWDDRRTAWLESRGYRVIRFKNADVARNLDGVVGSIAAALREAAPSH
jgi:very-short-patch-repair endonuclease